MSYWGSHPMQGDEPMDEEDDFLSLAFSYVTDDAIQRIIAKMPAGHPFETPLDFRMMLNPESEAFADMDDKAVDARNIELVTAQKQQEEIHGKAAFKPSQEAMQEEVLMAFRNNLKAILDVLDEEYHVGVFCIVGCGYTITPEQFDLHEEQLANMVGDGGHYEREYPEPHTLPKEGLDLAESGVIPPNAMPIHYAILMSAFLKDFLTGVRDFPEPIGLLATIGNTIANAKPGEVPGMVNTN